MASTLPSKKTDPNGIPLGASATNYIAAADINGILDHVAGWVNVKSHGAAGDSTTDDTAAVQAAITAADALGQASPIVLPAGAYLYTSLANPLGHWFVGPGRLVKSVSGGLQQTNSGLDTGKYVAGREYLSHFHKRLMARTGGKIVFSGDSTTDGVGTASTPYRIWELVPKYALLAGLPFVTGANRGQPSKTTNDWITTYLAGDLALAPDVIVVRWGLNDPATGRTIAQYAADLRSGLATIRASYSLAQLSIVLCTPSSTADTSAGRDEKWHEQVNHIVRQAARDYQAVFVDLYAYARDSRSGADWMDSWLTHPADVMNLWVSSVLADAILPAGLAQLAENRTVNASGSQAGYLADAVATSLEPAWYPRGVSIMRATNAGGWPYDGSVLTTRHADGSVMQVNATSAAPGAATLAMRSNANTASGWSAWWSSAGPVRVQPAFSGNIPIDVGQGTLFEIVAPDATAFTVTTPINMEVRANALPRITVKIKNTSGGALGTVTWASAYKMAAWVSPAAGTSRTVSFLYDGDYWVEEGRTPVDVPN